MKFSGDTHYLDAIFIVVSVCVRIPGAVNRVMCSAMLEVLGGKTLGNLDRVLRSNQNFIQVIQESLTHRIMAPISQYASLMLMVFQLLCAYLLVHIQHVLGLQSTPRANFVVEWLKRMN